MKCYICSKGTKYSAQGYLKNIPAGFWDKNTDPVLSLVPWYMSVHLKCLRELKQMIDRTEKCQCISLVTVH